MLTALPTSLNLVGIEGFYLLRNLPDASVTRTIKPMEFPDNSYQNILACLTSVNSTFVDDPMVRKEWNDWAHLHCPKSNSAMEYLEHLRTKKLPYHIPLKAILLPRATRINFPVWKDKPLSVTPVSNLSLFEWPEVISVAMHSVQTSMNMNPVESRLYMPKDQQLIMDINNFMTNVEPVYYDSLLKDRLTKEKLKAIIERKIGYSGETVARVSGKWLINLYLLTSVL
jgi:hypothetical protein